MCNATVIATLGSERFTLEKATEADGCSYRGRLERAGTFEVQAERDGATATSTRVDVAEDECHVISG